MKILTILTLTAELLSPFAGSQIKQERIKNSTGSGNGIYAGLVQASYSYSTSDANFTYGADLPLTYQFTTPLTYYLDVELNLREHVDYCSMSCSLTYPATNDYYLNYVGINCQITASNTSYNSFSLNIYNTDRATIRFIFTLEQLKDNYNYISTGPTASDMSVEWVDNGYSYVDIITFNVTSVTFTPDDPNYTPYLDGIEGYIDGIETSLGNIYTNVSDIKNLVSSINTNVNDIETLLTAINNMLVNKINNIEWLNIPLTYKGYTTDYSNFDNTAGWKEAGYYFYEGFFVYEPNKGMYKIEIPIGNTEINWSDIKIFTYYDNDVHQININYYLLFKNRYNITIYYFVNDHYSSVAWPNGNNPLVVYIGKRAYYYANQSMSAQYILQTSQSYWEIYNNITIQSQLRSIEDAIGNINVTNNTTVNEINTSINDYNTTIQNVYNIENNLNTTLQSSLAQYSPDNSSVLNKLQYSTVVYSNILGRLNNISVFALPLAVALAGIVLIAILG